ncbi:hypothetical protein [Anaplasma phagocytophilum]|uniref:hypothetical protein n=1 Tax=Anaplasma phagocytophilum TaxID=948 RepID=UPI000A4EEF35|nr:hypothetical protein [Anaplasma phagocytophilum]
MMLLLGRLISLLLLLPRLPVKTSFSLRMLLEFLIPVLMGRFVRRRPKVGRSMVSMRRKLRRVVVVIRHLYVGMMEVVRHQRLTTQDRR